MPGQLHELVGPERHRLLINGLLDLERVYLGVGVVLLQRHLAELVRRLDLDLVERHDLPLQHVLDFLVCGRAACRLEQLLDGGLELRGQRHQIVQVVEEELLAGHERGGARVLVARVDEPHETLGPRAHLGHLLQRVLVQELWRAEGLTNEGRATVAAVRVLLQFRLVVELGERRRVVLVRQLEEILGFDRGLATSTRTRLLVLVLLLHLRNQETRILKFAQQTFFIFPGLDFKVLFYLKGVPNQ